nr:hypothetical protein [Tanacetum cinerariifolium]
SDGESEEEETREEAEESFDPIPRTPEDNEDDGNCEEDQGLRISEEERIHEEEEADKLYRMESIFTTASSFVAPLPSPTSTMSPSIITTTTTASQLPIPPTPIPSEVLQNLPTFESIFRFEDRVKSLEVNFSEFMQTNQFPEAVSNISAACGRSSTVSQKLPEEAQPYKAKHVLIRSKATRSVYCLFVPKRIYLSKQGQENRLMRIDELHKFSDEMLNDVRNALDDRLKGIRMQYFPTTIWRKGDKDRAAAMIQAIDKMLKTRRIMRSLERFVGGRQYEGDFRMLQRTI